jgi:hypothetical protein|tara:strand:+ start:4039 stop:4242 length:204 start_codon:yes stop_codon:yes gene_type:complete
LRKWLDDYLDIDVVNWERHDAVQKNRKDSLCEEERQVGEEINCKDYNKGKKDDESSTSSEARLETDR